MRAEKRFTLPYEESMYVSGPGADTFGSECPVQSGHLLSDGTTRKFARIPCSVIVDSELSNRDKVVYASIALFERRGSVKTGIRQLGRACGIGKSALADSIENLERCGHIERSGRKRGQRQEYRLTSAVFRDPSKGAEGTIGAVSVCRKCGRAMKNATAAGTCRECARSADLEVRVGEALRILGAGATDEQIAAHLHLQKITVPVRRVLRKMERVA